MRRSLITPLGKHSNFTAIPHKQMVARLTTIPLEHRLVIQFYELFRKWSDSSGPLWAVDRTKAFRDCIMQSRARGGLTNKPEWVATTKSGNLKGTYRELFQASMTSYKGFRAVINLLNIYTIWTRQTLSTSELSEIQKEINQPPVVVGSSGSPGTRTLRKMRAVWYSKGVAFNNVDGRTTPTRVKCNRAEPLSQILPGKDSHVAQLGTDLSRIKNSLFYQTAPESIRQALGGYLMETWDPAYQQCPWTLEDLRKVVPKASCETREDAIQFVIRNQASLATEANVVRGRKDMVGRVNYTHEPGLKTRFFAAPNIVIQRALEPLKDGLFKVIRRLPWDCTTHQRKADDLIIRQMRDGKTVHTVDMSKATDNFPWEYQKAVLDMVMQTRDQYTADLIRLLVTTVERGEWHLGSGRTLKRCRWKKGQPLGLGPSFPLFTLTHGLVLFALNEGRWDSKFFVLGDDVIILDDVLANKYKKWLQTVKVNVSLAKSFSSSEVGQFAGKTYTPYGAFWAPKWNMITKSSVLDACAWWYPGLSQAFPHDSKLIDKVLSLPLPLGNGWNPQGLSLNDRLPDDIIDKMVERERLEKEKSSPAAVECSLDPIRLALKKAGYNAQEILSAVDLRIEPWRATYKSTRLMTTVPRGFYAPETEVPGYPLVRYHGLRVDPYSKGSLRSWKTMFGDAT